MAAQSAPDGREFARRLQERYPDTDWVAAVAERSGADRNTVEWHLQESMAPPEPIAAAARALLDEAQDQNGPRPLSDGNVAPDELPMAGVPDALGKLRAD